MTMGIFLDWPVGWYYLTAFLVAVWIVIMWYRKDFKLRDQIIVGLTITALAFVLELIAVSNGIWNYVPGNWPLILWPHYFLSGMVAFQIVKAVAKK